MAGNPGIPQNFNVQTANGTNLVSWAMSAGATSYTVQRSLDNVTFNTIAIVTGSPLATSYLDTAVTEGTQYWYKVAASNTVGSIIFTGQPNPSDTASIANVVLTAVASGAVGTQFNIGATVAATIVNFSQVVNSTIPGDVAASPTATQLLLSSYTAVTELASSLTNTTFTPFTTGGTSPYTTPQSVIPTMTGEM